MVKLETKESPIVLNSTVIVYHSLSETMAIIIKVTLQSIVVGQTHQSPGLIQVVEGRQILRLHCDITRIKPDGML